MAQMKPNDGEKNNNISDEKKAEILLKKYEKSAVFVDIVEAIEIGKKLGSKVS